MALFKVGSLSVRAPEATNYRLVYEQVLEIYLDLGLFLCTDRQCLWILCETINQLSPRLNRPNFYHFACQEDSYRTIRRQVPNLPRILGYCQGDPGQILFP